MTEGKGNVDALERLYKAYERGDLDPTGPVPDLFDERIEFSPLLSREIEGRTYQGHDGMREFFGELGETLEGIEYPDRNYEVLDENVIVMSTRLVGTARGSTVPFDQRLVMVFEFRAGLVRRATAYGSYDDALEAAKQVQRA